MNLILWPDCLCNYKVYLTNQLLYRAWSVAVYTFCPYAILSWDMFPILPQVQTRSADEPMTTFVFCNECGNRWKVRFLLLFICCFHIHLFEASFWFILDFFFFLSCSSAEEGADVINAAKWLYFWTITSYHQPIGTFRFFGLQRITAATDTINVFYHCFGVDQNNVLCFNLTYS